MCLSRLAISKYAKECVSCMDRRKHGRFITDVFCEYNHRVPYIHISELPWTNKIITNSNSSQRDFVLNYRQTIISCKDFTKVKENDLYVCQQLSATRSRLYRPENTEE